MDYDDYDYDDIPGELYDDEVRRWSPALLAETTAAVTPALTALFRRDRETLWINAYRETRLITLTYPPVALPAHDADTPGLVREVLIGRHANIGDAFYSLTSDAANNGWERRPCIYVDAGDPWDYRKSDPHAEPETPF
jgi:hypothetical protein